MREYDVVIIGAGPAGEAAAARAADNGLAVALVERELVGGECAYWACMPSKALLRPAEALAEAREAPGAREAITGDLDADAALERRDKVIHGLDDTGQAERLERHGVEIVRAHARLVGERRVEADNQLLEARKAVIVATGSDALIPPIEGLDEAKPWTAREATTAKRVPRSLVVAGGGVVGVELAQAWASLGCKRVTLLEEGEQLLADEEPFAGEQLEQALAGHGVDVRTGARVERAERDGNGVTTTTHDGTSFTSEELLIATGRVPRTHDVGLESLGIDTEGPLEVDDRARVPGLDWLYAVGDVNGRTELTHAGKYQARVAVDQILGRDARIELDGARSPRVVYTDPQLAAVGHTLDGARAAGIEAEAVDRPIAAIPGASFHAPHAEGTARLVIDERRRIVVGATFTGPEVAELLHAATIAVATEIPIDRLRHAIPAFPTRSELWLRLLESVGA